MRELVYLSDRKLEQFMPELRAFWPRPKVNIKLPVLEIAMEPIQDAEKKRLKHLARVIADIERSARWFTEPDIEPGQWVHFEAPLNYLSVTFDNHRPLFFVDRNTASNDYPTGSTTRLLFHCGGTHLSVGRMPVRIDNPAEETLSGQHQMHSLPGWFTDNVGLLLRKLCSLPPPADIQQQQPLAATPDLASAVSRLLNAIDARVFPETAAWMAGFARITANLPYGDARYIVASPLYVEYATPPVS